jgi:hypothetical protein
VTTRYKALPETNKMLEQLELDEIDLKAARARREVSENLLELAKAGKLGVVNTDP